MRHFYATGTFDWFYSMDNCHSPRKMVIQFKTKRERDAWVKQGDSEGWTSRSAVGSKCWYNYSVASGFLRYNDIFTWAAKFFSKYPQTRV